MAENFDFVTESTDLLERALKAFGSWAAENWTITPREAETLTEPTASPIEYARGYNQAINSIPDAVELWLGEYNG